MKDIIERLEDEEMYVDAVDDAIREIKLYRAFYNAAVEHLTERTFRVIEAAAAEKYRATLIEAIGEMCRDG